MNRQGDSASTFRGALGDTTIESIPVSRPEGGAFRADVYTSVDVSQDPDLERELIEGALNEVEDPETGETYRPAIPVRYHDPESRVFALVVPEELRHREFELRSELLAELADAEADIPGYVADFAVVFDPTELEAIEETGAEVTIHQSAPSEEDRADEGEAELEEMRAELEREREALEERRRELDTREDQLDQVQERIDRERERMDEFEEELVDEREELDEMRRKLEERADQLNSERQELEAEKLNLEETRRQMDRPEEEDPTEDTQVVTDDQLVEVSSTEEVQEEDGDIQVEEMGGVKTTNQRWDTVGETAPDSSPEIEQRSGSVELDRSSFPGSPEADAAPEAQVVDGRIAATCQLGDRLEALTDGAPTLFVQYHDIENYPVAAICIAALDDEGAVEASYGWPLDLADDADRELFGRLAERSEVQVGLFDESGEWAAGFRLRAPLEENVEWIRDRIDGELERGDLGSFREAAERYRDSDFERVGSMQQSFDREAFRQLETASQVKLAAGVLGFWSTDEMVEYLAANRSYPLDRFRELQLEVVEEALDTGIFLEEPLRELAIDEDCADDDVELAERLLANFAEVCVQLKSNDLEPVDEWENWDALIDFAQSVGVTPDADVVELAEASLKRARDFQETREAGGVPEEETDEPAEADQTAEDFVADPESVDADELVVSRRSESTGVTYFLPDEAVIDTFDDLDDMPREDLEKLLDDPNGRLEAAQMLLERFGGDAVGAVLDAAEEMPAPEVTALARFIESKADVLEPELVRAVESAGPSATFVAARALAEIASTSALPTLLEAFRDEGRETNRRGMARALASYGDKLVPPLARSIQQEGVNDDVLLLIQCLEEESPSAVEDLADHRDEDVREAVDSARDRSL